GGLARLRKDLSRHRGIVRDLRLQRIEPVELSLRPNEADHPDTQMLAVKVAGEIEQVDLEREAQAVHRRTPPQIGDAVIPARAAAVVHRGADGIDADGGDE